MPVNLQFDGHLSLQGQEVGLRITESCPEAQVRKFSPLQVDVTFSPFSPNEDALYKAVRRIKLGMSPQAPGLEGALRPAVNFIGQSSKKRPIEWLAPNQVLFSIQGFLIWHPDVVMNSTTLISASRVPSVTWKWCFWEQEVLLEGRRPDCFVAMP